VGARVFDCLWQLMNACAFLCGGSGNLLWVLFEVTSLELFHSSMVSTISLTSQMC
jgi:hypothetical protein